MSRFIVLLSAILVVLATLLQQAKTAAVPSSEEVQVAEVSSTEVEVAEDFQAASLPSSDIQAILKRHNDLRAKHHSPPLQWNETLSTYAQNWSNGCKFVHSRGPYGENLGYGYQSWNSVVDAWYGEVKDYNYLTPGFAMNTGHFTQVVWKSTTQVGCGVQTCDNLFKGAKLYTCSYAPFGNIVGNDYRTGKNYFEENVLRP